MYYFFHHSVELMTLFIDHQITIFLKKLLGIYHKKNKKLRIALLFSQITLVIIMILLDLTKRVIDWGICSFSKHRGRSQLVLKIRQELRTTQKIEGESTFFSLINYAIVIIQCVCVCIYICVDIISSKFGSNFFINRIFSHFYPMDD